MHVRTSVNGRRRLALLVLLIGMFQFAICAAGCDCLRMAGTGMSAPLTSHGDTDGCLCCAQSIRMPGIVRIPGPLAELFIASRPASRMLPDKTPDIDHPPRS
jgi:hypothetical protein